MRNTILIIVSVFLTGFLTPAQADNGICPDDGFMDARATISYGDAFIQAVPAYVKVCPGGKIIVTLAPEPEEYAIFEVELSGQHYALLDFEHAAPQKDAEWLDTAARALDIKDKDMTFVIAVPADQPPGIYKYKVIIPGIGKLDPRVEVLP